MILEIRLGDGYNTPLCLSSLETDGICGGSTGARVEPEKWVEMEISDEVFLTEDGRKKLVEELENLKVHKRREVAERLKNAISYGDLMENSEYDDAKNEQARVEHRIDQVETMLAKARIIDRRHVKTKEVGIGSLVELKQSGSGKETRVPHCRARRGEPGQPDDIFPEPGGPRRDGTCRRRHGRGRSPGGPGQVQDTGHKEVGRGRPPGGRENGYGPWSVEFRGPSYVLSFLMIHGGGTEAVMVDEKTDDGGAHEEETHDELLRARRAKLSRYRQRGLEPYKSCYGNPGEVLLSGELRAAHGTLEPGESSGSGTAVAGRLMARRKHGRAAFADLQDSAGRIQLLLRQDVLGEDLYEQFLDLDVGDWVGASGEVVRSRRGELSVAVQSFELLSKALRPLPEKWHGLKDREIRYRQRYLDLIMNEEARRVLGARNTVIREMRRFLDERGFIEVETPMLQPIPGGATARPFVTHHNALGMDLYLRIAPELYLKRLLVGGYDRVYEINRNFRNEGISTRHNPEFTMLEAYCAFVDYRYMMELLQDMIASVVQAVTGGLELELAGERIDMTPPWRRLTMLEAIVEYSGLELDLAMGRESLKELAASRDVHVPENAGPGWIIAELYEKLVEPKLVQPTFITDYPEEISPLARSSPDSPGFTERFEILVAGQEIANAFSELADPDEQRARFEAQAAKKASGDEEAHVVDEDYLLALEYGMPPAGGLGVGVDRLTMLVTGSQNIRDVIIFPHMRPAHGRATSRGVE